MHRSARTRLTALAATALATFALTACGSSGGSDDATVNSPSASTTTLGSATPEDTASAATQAPDKVIDVTLTGKTVTPAVSTQKVKKGDVVQITVTRDTAGEIHVHGYDLEKEAKAGEPVTFTFTADQQGVFEVEAHDPDLLLFQLEVD